MSSSTIRADALGMPSQQIPALQPGSKSVFDSAQKIGQQDQQQSSCLIGKCSGGSKKYQHKRISKREKFSKCKRMRGGVTSYVVPPISTNGIKDSGATQSNVNSITGATVIGNVNAGYDSCVGQGSACTAQVALSQQNLLKGGLKPRYLGKCKGKRLKSRKCRISHSIKRRQCRKSHRRNH
jgi:hypothetical protein